MEKVMNKIVFKKWINQKFEITQEMVNRKCLITPENIIFDIIQIGSFWRPQYKYVLFTYWLDISISKKNPITFGTEKN